MLCLCFSRTTRWPCTSSKHGEINVCPTRRFPSTWPWITEWPTSCGSQTLTSLMTRSPLCMESQSRTGWSVYIRTEPCFMDSGKRKKMLEFLISLLPASERCLWSIPTIWQWFIASVGVGVVARWRRKILLFVSYWMNEMDPVHTWVWVCVWETYVCVRKRVRVCVCVYPPVYCIGTNETTSCLYLGAWDYRC